MKIRHYPFQCQKLWNATAPGASCFSDSGTKRAVTIFNPFHCPSL